MHMNIWLYVIWLKMNIYFAFANLDQCTGISHVHAIKKEREKLPRIMINALITQKGKKGNLLMAKIYKDLYLGHTHELLNRVWVCFQ